QVAGRAQGVPAGREVVVVEAERVAHRVEDARAARVHDPRPDVGRFEVVLGEQRLDVAQQVRADELGQARGQHDLGPGVADAPAQVARGAGVQVGARLDDAGAGAAARRAVRAGAP